MTSSGKSTQELSLEGQRHLKDTIDSAYQILSSMNDELCNPTLWSSTTSAASQSYNGVNGDSFDSLHHTEIGVGALEQARLLYKSSVTSLRSVLSAIPNSQKVKSYEVGSIVGQSEFHTSQSEIEKLEEQVAKLKKELSDKNGYLKLLIDQLRELVTDISTWQSPYSV